MTEKTNLEKYQERLVRTHLYSSEKTCQAILKDIEKWSFIHKGTTLSRYNIDELEQLIKKGTGGTS